MEKPTSKIGFLGHYGLVKTFIDQLGISSIIDQWIHKPKRKNSVGNTVTAMILNGMGFTYQALYLTQPFSAIFL
jgi:transposase